MKTILAYLFTLYATIAFGQGFNLGQQHHRAHMIWRNNGYIPSETVRQWKTQVPMNARSFARQSGTMSNSWNLDSTGYNHLQHKIQLDNQRIPQPTISYFQPFLQFVRDWQYDSLAWTVNTILPYQLFKAGRLQESRYFTEQIFIMLDSVSAIVPISHIGIENEVYLYPDVIGISGGTPSASDKIRYRGTGGVFIPNGRFETDVRNQYRDFLNFVTPIVQRIRSEYPKAKIAMSCDHPITLRGRWNLATLTEPTYRRLWDVLDIHLYPNTKSRSETFRWVNDRIAGFNGLPIVVFEWNYHYDSGNPYSGFHRDMEELLRPYLHLRHTLWFQGSGFTFIQ